MAVAPEFLFRSTTNRSIVIGETLTLACRALANPIAKVTWLRNSVSEMSLGAFITTVTVGMEVISTLSFSNFTEMDSGTYSCLAMNDFGSIREDFQIDIASVYHCICTTKEYSYVNYEKSYRSYNNMQEKFLNINSLNKVC